MDNSQELKGLQKELAEAQTERDILQYKGQVSSLFGRTIA